MNKDEYKTCSACKQSFPKTDGYFYKQKTKYGYRLSSECKMCNNARAVKCYYDNHQKNLDNKAKYRKTHKREIAEYLKWWDKNHKEYLAENSKTWRKNNPEKLSEYCSRHRKHNVTKDEWISCKKYFKNCCAYCGISIEDYYKIFNQDFHKEHVNDKGANDLSNCIPACKNCNSEKHTKKLEDWYNLNNKKYSNKKHKKILSWIEKDYLKYLDKN